VNRDLNNGAITNEDALYSRDKEPQNNATDGFALKTQLVDVPHALFHSHLASGLCRKTSTSVPLCDLSVSVVIVF